MVVVVVVEVVLVMLDQVFLSWHGVLVLEGKTPVKQRVLKVGRV